MREIRTIAFLLAALMCGGIAHASVTFTQMKSGYFEHNGPDTPQITWAGQAMSFTNKFCLYRDQTLAYGPTFLVNTIYDESVAGATSVFEYWGIAGVTGASCPSPSSSPTTNTATAVPRVHYTSPAQSGTTVTATFHKVTNYSAVYVYATAPNNPDFVPVQIGTLTPALGDETKSFSLNGFNPAFIYNLHVYGSVGPQPPISPDLLEDFPPADSLFSRTFTDPSFLIDLSAATPPAPPANLAAVIAAAPAQIALSWSNGDSYDAVVVSNGGEQHTLRGRATTFTFFNEPIGEAQTYTVRGIRQGLSSPTISIQGPVPVPQPPEDLALQGGVTQFIINADPPEGDYMPPNAIAETKVYSVNTVTGAQRVDIIEGAPPLKAYPVSDVNPGSYLVSLTIVANGVESPATPAENVVVDPPQSLEPPAVTIFHTPQGTQNPAMYYQATFTLSADQIGIFTYVQVRDLYSGQIVAILSAGNNFTQLAPISQMGEAKFFAQGFQGALSSQTVLLSGKILPMRPLFWAWVNGQAQFNPGHVLFLRVEPNLPPNHPYQASVAVHDEHDSTAQTLAFPFSGYPSSVNESIAYPANHAGDGAHHLTIFIEGSIAGEIVATSELNTADVSLGVRHYDFNDDDQTEFWDLIDWYKYYSPAPPEDPHYPGFWGDAPHCIEVTNGNENAFATFRSTAPHQPYHDPSPWDNLDDAALHCSGPNFDGKDAAGNPLPNENWQDWMGSSEGGIFGWTIIFDSYVLGQPVRDKPPGFYATPPPKPGERGYDPMNACMTSYIHHQAQGAYNQRGIACTHGPYQSGYPNQIDAAGVCNNTPAGPCS